MLLDAVRQRVQRSPILIERVSAAGAVAHERIASFFSAADLFIVGIHHEGIGYALMEACAAGDRAGGHELPTFRLLTAGNGRTLWTPVMPGLARSRWATPGAASLDARVGRGSANHFVGVLSS